MGSEISEKQARAICALFGEGRDAQRLRLKDEFPDVVDKSPLHLDVGVFVRVPLWRVVQRAASEAREE